MPGESRLRENCTSGSEGRAEAADPRVCHLPRPDTRRSGKPATWGRGPRFIDARRLMGSSRGACSGRGATAGIGADLTPASGSEGRSEASVGRDSRSSSGAGVRGGQAATLALAQEQHPAPSVALSRTRIRSRRSPRAAHQSEGVRAPRCPANGAHWMTFLRNVSHYGVSSGRSGLALSDPGVAPGSTPRGDRNEHHREGPRPAPPR
jgi:hypothetical protein